jgi:hypothetical protein
LQIQLDISKIQGDGKQCTDLLFDEITTYLFVEELPLNMLLIRNFEG